MTQRDPLMRYQRSPYRHLPTAKPLRHKYLIYHPFVINVLRFRPYTAEIGERLAFSVIYHDRLVLLE